MSLNVEMPAENYISAYSSILKSGTQAKTLKTLVIVSYQERILKSYMTIRGSGKCQQTNGPKDLNIHNQFKHLKCKYNAYEKYVNLPCYCIMIIINNKNFKIEKEKETTFSYFLHVYGENRNPLIVSLLMSKLMPGANYNSSAQEISFVAEKVSTLSELLKTYKDGKMPYSVCVRMIYCISRQLDELEKTHKFFYGLDLDNILVINDDIFLIASLQYLMPMSDKTFIFYSPFQMPFFSSPELLSTKSIPAEIHFKCFYYSLGGLFMHCLFGKTQTDNEDLEKTIDPISQTKMYWFLKRCFASDPSKRSLLFI